MDNVPNTSTSYVFPTIKVLGTTNINGLQINGRNGTGGYVLSATGTGSGVAWTPLAAGTSQWTGTVGSPIYYVPNVGIGASTAATAKLQVTGNLYVSNSVTTTNVYATRFVGDGGLLSNVTAVGFIQPLSNLVVSNSVTTTNVFVNGTLSVPGAMTSNIANTTFYYDTFTIPYINTQVLNTASLYITSNMTVALANVATLNVASVSNLATLSLTGTAGVTTLNVTGNVFASNAFVAPSIYGTLTGTHYGVLAGSNTMSGSTQTLGGTAGVTTLNVTGNVFASNALVAPSVYGTSIVGGTMSGSTQTLGGTAGVTTLNVTGNAYISNTVTVNNVYSLGSVSIAGDLGITTLKVTGNVFASNALVVGTSVSIPASSGETIQSYGPLIIGNGTNDYSRFISALDLSMTAGNSRYISFGQSASTNNQGELKFLYAGAGSTSNRLGFGVYGGEYISVLGSGNVGISVTAPTTYRLQVSGTIGATGDITAFTSDERLKTKTGSLTDALDKVCTLETFTYTHNELARSFGFVDKRQYVGISAQQIQKVLPETVRRAPFDSDTIDGVERSKSGQDYLTVQYERIVPLLIEALKEERKAREALEESLRTTTRELRSLEQRIKLLEKS